MPWIAGWCARVAVVVSLMTMACSGEAPLPPVAPTLDTLPKLPDVVDATSIPRGLERPVREIALTFVGEVRGEIEPCGCPTLPYGGFSRRERLLDQLRAMESVVHFDAGETLVKGLITVSLEERTARAQDILGLSRGVGVQAWAPGPTDLLALGLDGIRDVLAGRLEGPPPISATWEDLDGRLILPPTRIVEVDGARLGVIGLSAAPTAPEIGGVVRMRDPVDAARAAIKQLPADLDLIIGLGTLADVEADRVAEAVPEIAVMLTTRGVTADEPRQVELPARGALVVESTDRGRYLTIVRTRLGADGAQPLVAHPTRQEWKNLRTARAQVEALRGLPEVTDRRSPDDDARSPERLAAAQAERIKQEETFEREGRGRNLAFVSTVPLAEDLDGATQIDRRIQAVKDEVADRAEDRAQQPPEEHSSFYASSSACVSCHVSETARWAYSDHSKAWRSIVKRGEQENVECVGCHSTGFGQPGGFGELTAANVGRFKAVQCEACHGPMGAHPGNPSVTPDAITPEVCIGCHDSANSPNFDFEAYMRRATCQGGAPEVMSAPP